MVKSRLPNPVLAKVWRLADVDQDGMLDADEFALAMHLINIKLDGFDLPDDLPNHLIPPSKKRLFNGGGASGSGSGLASLLNLVWEICKSTSLKYC